jgi:uncharacterized protein (DUF2062 family)
MPKRIINKYLPNADKVIRHRSLRWLGELLHDTNLWHLNRRSVATAVFVGLFSCFMPIPMQMLLAAILAIYLHCNLPISVSLVWISNPLTYVPIFYISYRFGLKLMSIDHDPSEFVWEVESLRNNLSLIWKPLLLGSIVAGLLVGSLGYMFVRLLWRIHIQRAWLKRKAMRARQIGSHIKDSSVAFAKQKGQEIKEDLNKLPFGKHEVDKDKQKPE